MLARSYSFTTLGVDAIPVDVEVDIARGLPALTIVGLPDQTVKEAKERVRAAILNSQYQLPSQRLIVNLAPADVKKIGGTFDLAIALGLLAASGQLDPAALASVAVVGELALDGSVRPVHGILPIALALRPRPAGHDSRGGPRPDGRNRRRLLIPCHNVQEAAVVEGVEVIPIASLQEAVDRLSGRLPMESARFERRAVRPAAHQSEVDFADVKGQAHAKRALEIATALQVAT